MNVCWAGSEYCARNCETVAMELVHGYCLLGSTLTCHVYQYLTYQHVYMTIGPLTWILMTYEKQWQK